MLKVFFMLEKCKSLLKRREGQGLVEYALIIALVSVLLVASLTTFKGDIAKVFADIKTAMTTTP